MLTALGQITPKRHSGVDSPLPDPLSFAAISGAVSRHRHKTAVLQCGPGPEQAMVVSFTPQMCLISPKNSPWTPQLPAQPPHACAGCCRLLRGGTAPPPPPLWCCDGPKVCRSQRLKWRRRRGGRRKVAVGNAPSRTRNRRVRLLFLRLVFFSGFLFFRVAVVCVCVCFCACHV